MAMVRPHRNLGADSGRYQKLGKQVALALLMLCISSSPVGITQTRQQRSVGRGFPAFRLIPGKIDQDDNPISGARLCLLLDPHNCFTSSYGYPSAQRVFSNTGESLVLFSAVTHGVSASLAQLSLLRYEHGEIKNLLPQVGLTNQGSHAFWNILPVSSMPVFITADYISEEGEGVYGSHHFEIHAYSYDFKVAHYREILSYRTQQEYRWDDPLYKAGNVLESEHTTILNKLLAH
jgi:hypothetical protein